MILVTGGAGFIGSNLVKELNNRGRNDIVIVDKLGTDGKWKNLVGLQYCDYIELDDFAWNLKSHIATIKPTVVFHMGACSSTTENDASYLIKNNYEFSKRLLLSCLRLPGCRFIYASSAATYGNTDNFSDDHDRLPDLQPINAYGLSKHMFDLWCWRGGYLKDVVGLKFFNVFGPGEDHKGNMMSFQGKTLHWLRSCPQAPIPTYLRPILMQVRNERDFIFIDDAISATLHFMDASSCGIYNIGTGLSLSFASVALDITDNVTGIDRPDVMRRDGYQYFTCADISKLRSAGYNKPFTPHQDAIEKYRTYIRSNT